MSGQSVTASTRLLKLPEDCHQLIMKCLVVGDAGWKKGTGSARWVVRVCAHFRTRRFIV
jgi:hypothetical protein